MIERSLSRYRQAYLISCCSMTDSLAVFDVDHWLRQPRPADFHVSQPYQVACWSKLSQKEGGRICYGNTEGLNCYKRPELPANLGQGYPEAYTQKDEEASVGVEQVATAVAKAGLQDQCDVCTFRNNLNKIFATPVDLKSPWVVDACMLQHTLHLDIHKIPQHTFPNADLFQYYGYRFEALSTQQTEVDATSEYCAVVRLRLDKLRVMMAAEVDCYDPDKVKPGHAPDLASYLELKTYVMPEDQRKAANIKKFKYPKWWLQSWLAGVPSVIAGARDKQGWLRSIETVPTRQIPNLSAEANVGFNPWEQIGFGRDVLTWMQHMTGLHREKQLQFSYQEEGNRHAIRCMLVNAGSLAERVRSVQ
ncbi:hypothetical protein ABBQ38_005278 [Trebouxia sp. C0009 RCD-2024]